MIDFNQWGGKLASLSMGGLRVPPSLPRPAHGVEEGVVAFRKSRALWWLEGARCHGKVQKIDVNHSIVREVPRCDPKCQGCTIW